MIGIELAKYLRTRPAVQTKVGSRVFAKKPEDTPLPNVLVTVYSGGPTYALGGPLGDLAKLVQVDVDAESYEEVIDIAERIRREIENFRGVWGATVVQNATIVSERDQAFPTDVGDDARVYRRSVDYRIHYQRS